MDIAASSTPDGLVVELVASFDAFYIHEYPATVRLLTALTGRRDVAEELAQDVFVTAHARWHAVHHYERPDAWVRRVAVNRGTSWLRRRSVEARLLIRLGARPTPAVQLSESAEETWRAVRHLPARQAQVIALVYLEDRSVADVAEILGCSPDTIRTHLRRARTTLAAQLRLSNENPDTSRPTDGEEP
ncbi:MAG: RNA polymerase sigma factor [Mycobacterium sp.]